MHISFLPIQRFNIINKHIRLSHRAATFFILLLAMDYSWDIIALQIIQQCSEMKGWFGFGKKADVWRRHKEQNNWSWKPSVFWKRLRRNRYSWNHERSRCRCRQSRSAKGSATKQSPSLSAYAGGIGMMKKSGRIFPYCNRVISMHFRLCNYSKEISISPNKTGYSALPQPKGNIHGKQSKHNRSHVIICPCFSLWKWDVPCFRRHTCKKANDRWRI